MLSSAVEALVPWVFSPKVNLVGLLDPLAIPVLKILNTLKQAGWQPCIIEAVRTVAQERIKVDEGYSHTMHSMHLLGRAVDIVDKRYLWQGIAEDLNFKFWTQLGAAAHANHLEWGGNWPDPDVAHVQLFGD